MPPFREKLLTEVTGICQQLYNRRLALVKTQGHVSENAKQDVIRLVLRLNVLRGITPFPGEHETDMSPLDKLKADIAAADSDQFAIQKKLMEWATAFHPTVAKAHEGPASSEAALRAAPSPINQRMIDGLASFRATVDRTRINLMLKGDPADLDEYTAARNAFTLARAVFEERLKLNQVTATNADCTKLEQVLTPAVSNASGATFPATIQDGADFISDKLFV